MAWEYGKLFKTAEEFLAWVKPILTATITEVHVHHTWEPSHADFTGSNHRALQDAMRRYHLSQGWADIAQHCTIFPDGSIMTGRNINQPPASATGYNDGDADGRHPFMFEMLGNFDTGHDKLEGKQLESAVKLTRYFSGGDENKIRFHREMNPHKTCPGSGVDKSWFVGLVKSAGQANTSTASAYPGHPLQRGDRGDAVKVLQKRLEIPADGIFGQLTEQAVKNWQRVHDEHGRVVAPGKGLVADGVVGPKTWAALFGK